MTLLQLGDYRRGLAEYEWRWKTGQFTPFHCPHPRWDGSLIPGQTLLIHTEQGAGDAIQFARYLPLAAERVGKLILVCTPNLFPLFATVPGIAEIREPGTFQLTEFDTYVPLLSLPHVFGATLETIPAELPYIDVALLRRRKTVPLPPLPPGRGEGIHSSAGNVSRGSSRWGWSGPAVRPTRTIATVRVRCGSSAGATHPRHRLLQRAERGAQPGAAAITAGVRSARSRGPEPGIRRHGAAARPTGPAHHRRYLGRAYGGRAGQAGVGAPVPGAGLALGVRGRDHTVVPDDAVISASPGRGLGGSDDTGGEALERM